MERGIDNQAVFDDTLVEHIGNNASNNTAMLPIVTYRATLDEAIGNDTIASDTCGDTASPHTVFREFDSCILHTETIHSTRNDTEDTCYAIDCYTTIADGMSTTVVDTTESV